MNYFRPCECGAPFTLEPVPGAQQFPKRKICTVHGYPSEKHSAFITSQSELEKQNDYVTEIASPADVIEIGGKEVSLY